MNWTAEQILALAPDATSAKNGQSLATGRKWQNCGRSESVAWGECQGSGSKPYRTQIDLAEPAFRCSCPSRKFPCKHGLGLFLLLAQSDSLFTDPTPPDWVQEWLESRHQRQAKQQEKAAEKAATIADPQAQAKRQEKRAKKVDAGVAELQQWLADLLRRGLASAAELSYQQWEQVAARMVDAQAPGLARRLQAMAGTAHSGTGWPERLLSQLGALHLLLESYQRLETLPPALQADVRSQIGWTMSQEEVLATAQVVTDHWVVLGQRDEVEDPLRIRRIWLQGVTSQTLALILLFAHGKQPFEVSFLPGTVVPAELAFFPSTYPQRAIVQSRSDTLEAITPAIIAKTAHIVDLFAQYSHALSQQPWLERLVVTLQAVTVVQRQGQGAVCDRHNNALPIGANYPTLWELIALGGGHAIDLTGEWNGSEFYPLSAWVQGEFVVL
ncbi:SWIM zinc finger family protein [Alkalinema pantanalense CENA528]|uniref:SWIM zinc finger family protein n=1 Tax=Alkalinema pantanalense TaxID=1620705 RepID=UPI003D6DB469